MRLALIAIAALSLAGASAFAPAAAQQMTPPIEAAELAPGQLGSLVRDRFLAAYSRAFGRCADEAGAKIVFVQREELEVQEASLKRQGSLPADSKLFRERYHVIGCGPEQRTINVTAMQSSGRAVPVFGHPGETRSNELVQFDFNTQVATAIGVVARSCRNARTIEVWNTALGQPITLEAFAAARGPATSPRRLIEAWEETWSVRACGASYDLPVKLALDEMGGFGFVVSVDQRRRR
jgi:hypothetical protein